ncbi:hypothetical protein A7R75_29650 [Mycolicibacterium llatzerense]|nr:hypothetical protein [Mycolicibacterium llatzerense]
MRRWLFTLTAAAASAAAAVGMTLALTAHRAGDSAGNDAAAYPGRWVGSHARATADRATCAGYEQAAAIMHEAADLVTVDLAGRKAATDKYDRAAATMYRATTIETHFDLSFAAQTFTAALRTLVVARTTPEAFAAADAAGQTVAAMCARRSPVGGEVATS